MYADYITDGQLQSCYSDNVHINDNA